MKLPKNESLIKFIAICIAISLVIAIEANDLFGPPKTEQIKHFEGNVYRFWVNNKDHRLSVSAMSADDKITVRFPKFISYKINKAVKEGDFIKIGYFRASPLADINAWSATINGREQLNYENVLFHYSGLRSPIPKYALYMSMLSAALASLLYIFNFYISNDHSRHRK